MGTALTFGLHVTHPKAQFSCGRFGERNSSELHKRLIRPGCHSIVAQNFPLAVGQLHGHCGGIGGIGTRAAGQGDHQPGGQSGGGHSAQTQHYVYAASTHGNGLIGT